MKRRKERINQRRKIQEITKDKIKIITRKGENNEIKEKEKKSLPKIGTRKAAIISLAGTSISNPLRIQNR